MNNVEPSFFIRCSICMKWKSDSEFLPESEFIICVTCLQTQQTVIDIGCKHLSIDSKFDSIINKINERCAETLNPKNESEQRIKDTFDKYLIYRRHFTYYHHERPHDAVLKYQDGYRLIDDDYHHEHLIDVYFSPSLQQFWIMTSIWKYIIHHFDSVDTL